MKNNLPTILLIIALLLIPAAIVLEKSDAKLWNDRLFVPDFVEEPNRHTPVHPLGTFLPPTITKDTTYTARDNPIIIASNIEVPSTVALTFQPGSQIFVHEHSGLNVSGTLSISGTTTDPVTFTTNEEHLENRTWNGITIQENARATIAHTELRYGTPAISCLIGSRATIINTKFELGNLALYTESPNCILRDSTINSVRDGVIGVGVKPQVLETNITVKNKDIQTFESRTSSPIAPNI